MTELLRSLYPRRPERVEFRSGPQVYINLENLQNAYVLADALAEHGAIKVAEDLSAFARGVERELRREWVQGEELRAVRRQKGVATPSWEKWKDLRKRIDHTLTDIFEGADFYREAQAPFVHFRAERVRLDRGGYDSQGKYWGGGLPLYRISAFLPENVTKFVLDHPATHLRYRSGIRIQSLFGTDEAEIDHYVRADDAKDAREQVARKLGLRTRRRV